MKKLYFIDSNTSFSQDWDGISEEPDNIASFEVIGVPSTASKRYLLLPNNTYMSIFPEIPDDKLDDFIREQNLLINPKPINPVEFKLRFTKEERIAMYESTNPYVMDFLKLIDDTRLFSMNLNSRDTIEVMDLLVSLGILTQDRKATILI